MKTPDCPYCGAVSQLVDGSVIYPHRPDLREKQFYLCKPCDAYVGCHPGTTRPLGRLADAKLRAAKKAAHANFDRLWKSGEMGRSVAYAKLSKLMSIPADQTHIGMFNVEQCFQVIKLVRSESFKKEI